MTEMFLELLFQIFSILLHRGQRALWTVIISLAKYLKLLFCFYLGKIIAAKRYYNIDTNLSFLCLLFAM